MTNDFAYIQNRVSKDGIIFQLRPASVSDTDIIASNICEICAEQIYLHSDTFVITEEWHQMLGNSVDEKKGQLLIVAQAEGQIVGHLRLFPLWYGTKGRHVGEVGMAIVKPWRERGVGKAMMDYAVSWACLAQFQKIIVSVISTNHRALTLFSNLGFTQEGCLVQQINIAGRYVDDILLGRFINHYRK